MYEMNIYFNIQDKARPTLPQPVKTVMYYLQQESHHWSLVYCVSFLPFPLLYVAVSCNFVIKDNTVYIINGKGYSKHHNIARYYYK